MKKIYSFGALLLLLCSCNNEADTMEIRPKEEVEFCVDYSFSESGDMTRGSNAYSAFYEKCIKSKELTPKAYSLTFINKESGARAEVNGLWDNKDGIKLLEGEYEVSGTSYPYVNVNVMPEYSDTVFLFFNQTVKIERGIEKLNLEADYDSFLLLFDRENNKSVTISKKTGNGADSKVMTTDKELGIYWAFLTSTGKNGYYYSVKLERNDGKKTSIELEDMPFENGKYYYFNDIDNSFNIPTMDAGN